MQYWITFSIRRYKSKCFNFCDCIVGNSSRGVIEALILKKQEINIENRPQDRFKFDEVIDVSKENISLRGLKQNIFNLVNRVKDFNLKEFMRVYVKNSPTNKFIMTFYNSN